MDKNIYPKNPRNRLVMIFKILLAVSIFLGILVAVLSLFGVYFCFFGKIYHQSPFVFLTIISLFLAPILFIKYRKKRIIILTIVFIIIFMIPLQFVYLFGFGWYEQFELHSPSGNHEIIIDYSSEMLYSSANVYQKIGPVFALVLDRNIPYHDEVPNPSENLDVKWTNKTVQISFFYTGYGDKDGTIRKVYTLK